MLRRHRIIFFGLACGVAVGWWGCSPAYVLKAGLEEAKILWRRQPIAELLRKDQLDGETRAKLEFVLRARQFAADVLRLNVRASFETYARLDADQVVHVVVAAERLCLEPYTWWFPIVGRVPYKGFFTAAEAQAEAARLEEAGYDTYVRTSSAFSTLGWFDDPLLSTTLRRDRVALIETVFHELLHSTSYIGGHADFDESFANFVGHRSAILFLETQDDAAALDEARRRWHDALQFSGFLSAFLDDLARAYAAGLPLGDRAALFEQGQARFRTLAFQTDAYAGFAVAKLNNAILLHERLYFDRLILFEEVLRRQGDDLPRTIRAILDATIDHDGDPYAAVAALVTVSDLEE